MRLPHDDRFDSMLTPIEQFQVGLFYRTLGVVSIALLVACGEAAESEDPYDGVTGGVAGVSSGGTAGTNGGAGTSPNGGSAGSTPGGSTSVGGVAGNTGQAGGGQSGSPGMGGQSTGGSIGAGAGGQSGGASGSNGMDGGGGRGGSGGMGKAGAAGAGGGGIDPSFCVVGPVPAALRQSWDIDPFYQKYANANGIPILTSNQPPNTTLVLACQLVIEMVSDRDDVRLALIDNQVHFAIVGVNELTNDIPEYSDMPDSINTRARGLGGIPGLCSEESILCGPTDRWRGESICVHEFAHTISIYGLYDADPTFQNRLRAAYQSARSAGLWANTYAIDNEQDYWAEGVQNWYYTNLESATPNGVHGPIDKREEMESYDPVLYDLIDELLPLDVSWDDCYRDG
jgi:hypothetical protein